MNTFRYDAEVDALTLHLSDRKILHTEELDDGILVDLDADGNIVGVEILDLQDRLNEVRSTFHKAELMAGNAA